MSAPFLPADYGPVLAPLVSGDRARALDAGRPDAAVRRALELATVEAAFAQATIVDRDMATAALAGVWLVHDFLDESHALSQRVDTPTGAFWHGVMHRREGDYANAKYWFRRADGHEALDLIGARLHAVAAPETLGPLVRRRTSGVWYDPAAMTDACQQALRARGGDVALLQRVQQAEWEALFDFSYRRATGP